MNTVSTELCKELCKDLFELSRWGRGDESLGVHFVDDGRRNGYGGTVHTLYPAYNLGYLLRKLQEDDLTIVLRWNRDMGGRIATREWDNKYCIGTFDMPQGEYPIADTAEDAAAKLVIELLKRGVLQRDGIS